MLAGPTEAIPEINDDSEFQVDDDAGNTTSSDSRSPTLRMLANVYRVKNESPWWTKGRGRNNAQQLDRLSSYWTNIPAKRVPIQNVFIGRNNRNSYAEKEEMDFRARETSEYLDIRKEKRAEAKKRMKEFRANKPGFKLRPNTYVTIKYDGDPKRYVGQINYDDGTATVALVETGEELGFDVKLDDWKYLDGLAVHPDKNKENAYQAYGVALDEEYEEENKEMAAQLAKRRIMNSKRRAPEFFKSRGIDFGTGSMADQNNAYKRALAREVDKIREQENDYKRRQNEIMILLEDKKLSATKRAALENELDNVGDEMVLLNDLRTYNNEGDDYKKDYNWWQLRKGGRISPIKSSPESGGEEKIGELDLDEVARLTQGISGKRRRTARVSMANNSGSPSYFYVTQAQLRVAKDNLRDTRNKIKKMNKIMEKFEDARIVVGDMTKEEEKEFLGGRTVAQHNKELGNMTKKHELIKKQINELKKDLVEGKADQAKQERVLYDQIAKRIGHVGASFLDYERLFNAIDRENSDPDGENYEGFMTNKAIRAKVVDHVVRSFKGDRNLFYITPEWAINPIDKDTARNEDDDEYGKIKANVVRQVRFNGLIAKTELDALVWTRLKQYVCDKPKHKTSNMCTRKNKNITKKQASIIKNFLPQYLNDNPHKRTLYTVILEDREGKVMGQKATRRIEWDRKTVDNLKISGLDVDVLKEPTEEVLEKLIEIWIESGLVTS